MTNAHGTDSSPEAKSIKPPNGEKIEYLCFGLLRRVENMGTNLRIFVFLWVVALVWSSRLRHPSYKRGNADDKCREFVVETEKASGFKLLSVYGFQIKSPFHVTLHMEVEASSAVKVALMSDNCIEKPKYLVGIGNAAVNVNYSYILNIQEQAVSLYGGSYFVRPNQFRHFMIAWRRGNTIEVKDGEDNMLMTWTDYESPLNITNIGVATAEGSGKWKIQCEEQKSTCQSNEFQCKDSSCININDRCNGIADCIDGSDECGCDGTSACGDGEFQCVYNGVAECYPDSFICDDYKDCDDNSDENNCDTTTPAPTTPSPVDCQDDEFQCIEDGKPKCHPDWYKCDQYKDCDDNSDEENCDGGGTQSTTTAPTTGDCQDDEFQCIQGGNPTCHPDWYKCDQYQDCDDNSDEQNCDDGGTQTTTTAPTTGDCQDDEFQCIQGGNPTCHPDWYKCDQYQDCDDNSDEENCDDGGTQTTTTTTPSPTKCQDDEFQCIQNGSPTCHPASYKCDNYKDCDDNSDEAGCDDGDGDGGGDGSGNCGDDSVKCDMFKDCDDGADEDGDMCKAFTCPAGKFKCSDGVTCVATSARCDGYQDCPTGDDEKNCEAATCTSSQFKCPNSYCIPSKEKCNGIPDCENGADEEGCSGCPSSTMERCGDNTLCIQKTEKCDGFTDCPDKSDEANCGRSVSPSRRAMLKEFEKILRELKSRSKRHAVRNGRTHVVRSAMKAMYMNRKNVQNSLRGMRKPSAVERLGERKVAMLRRQKLEKMKMMKMKRYLMEKKKRFLSQRKRNGPTH